MTIAEIKLHIVLALISKDDYCLEYAQEIFNFVIADVQLQTVEPIITDGVIHKTVAQALNK